MPHRGHNNARVRVTVVAALDAKHKLLEYWWSVTPELIVLRDPNNPKVGNVKVTWEIKGTQLTNNKNIPNFDWDGASGGVVMNQDANAGPVWDYDCGEPVRNGNTYELTVTDENAPQPRKRFKYSCFLKVGDSKIVIDPEVEYDGG